MTNTPIPVFMIGDAQLGVAYTETDNTICFNFYENGQLIVTGPITTTKYILKLENGILYCWDEKRAEWFSVRGCWRINMSEDPGFATYLQALFAARLDNLAYSVHDFVPFQCQKCKMYFSYEALWFRFHDDVCQPCVLKSSCKADKE